MLKIAYFINVNNISPTTGLCFNINHFTTNNLSALGMISPLMRLTQSTVGAKYL